MKAILMDFYGGAEVLYHGEAAEPAPTQDQALIRVIAAGVNPADFKWRMGMFHHFAPLTFPHVLGYDVAGIVKAAPPDSDFQPGMRIAAMLDGFRQGAYAEYAAVDLASLALLPEGLAFETAAALPTAGLTGVQLVEEHLCVRPGQTVLITGATGAVGRFALYAAKRRGAFVVAAVRPSQRDLAKALGADAVLTLGKEDWAGGPIACLGDTVGGEAVAALCRHVPASGRIFTVATAPISPEALKVAPVFCSVRASGNQLAALAAAAVAGEMDIPIARMMPLAEAANAHILMQAGGLGGKIVLTV